MDALVWHDIPRDGIENMAIDESMAVFAGANNTLILRLYYWERPFLSLGYFQSASDRLAYPLLRNLPYTRRLSGGGAIIHDREVTYSLAIPDSTGSKSPASLVYAQVHAAVRESLQNLGFEVHTAAELGLSDAASHEAKVEPFLCFQRRSDADLIVADHKIVGSAQRRISGVILQHGSILLSASSHAPNLLGLAEINGSFSPSNQNTEGFLADLNHRLRLVLEQAIPGLNWIASKDLINNRLSTIQENSRRFASEKYNCLSWKDKR